MNSKIVKNIIIGIVVIIVLFLIYIFFIKKGPVDTALVSSTGTPIASDAIGATTLDDTSSVGKDFISLLLSVKSIKLDDSIFKKSAFLSLKDSSIVLSQDGNEGRLNPFAPIGSESMTTNPIPAVVPSLDNSTSLDTNNVNSVDSNTNNTNNTGNSAVNAPVKKAVNKKN